MAQRKASLVVFISDGADGISDLVVELRSANQFGLAGSARSRTDKRGYVAFDSVVTKFARRSKHLLLRVLRENGRAMPLAEIEISAPEQDRLVEVRLTLPELSQGNHGRIAFVSGQRLDAAVVAKIPRADLIMLHDFLHGRRRELPQRELFERAFPDLFQRGGDVAGGLNECVEGLLDVVPRLLAMRGDFDADLADPDDLPPPVASWQIFFTQNVEVAYTTDAVNLQQHALTGTHAAMPLGTTNYSLNTGTPQEILIGQISNDLNVLNTGLPLNTNTTVPPTKVQRVALLAERSWRVFTTSPYSLRDPKLAAARLKIRLCQLPATALGGTDAGWDHVRINALILMENEGGTVPHEVFHRVQYKYNPTTDATDGIYKALREGGARLAEDCFNDVPNRYVRTAGDLFDKPWSSLVVHTDSSGMLHAPLDYETGVMWKYLAEQHGLEMGEPAIGIDCYRAVLQATATIDATGSPLPTPPAGTPFGYDVRMLRVMRQAVPWYGLFDRFTYLDAARTELLSHETTWGNYVLANMLHGTVAASGDTRFRYREDAEPVLGDAPLGTRRSAVLAGDEAVLSNGATLVFPPGPPGLPWGVRYWRIKPDVGAAAPGLARITVNAGMSSDGPLTQIALIDGAGSLIDVRRSDRPDYQTAVSTQGVAAILVAVANREGAVQPSLTVTSIPPAPLVAATRWNTRKSTSYEINPEGWSWTWISPDVMVDTDGDNMADNEVFFGRDNVLKLRVRNRGNAQATNVTAQFWYQKAAPHLSPTAWLPVADTLGGIQTGALPTLAAGQEDWISVLWAPDDDGSGHSHWCVKARLTTPGDPSLDGKVVLSNFSNLRHAAAGDTVQIRQFYVHAAAGNHSLHVIPRGARWRYGRAEVLRGDVRLGAAARRRGRGCLCENGDRLPQPAAFGLLDVSLVSASPCATHAWTTKDDRHARPRSGWFYPTDPKALPPGVQPQDLVTITQLLDGAPVGGITYRLVDDSEPERHKR